MVSWGTSEWSADEIREAHRVAREHHLTPPTMEQPHYNMFVRERVEKEYATLYDDPGLGTTTWSPLHSGLLSGKYLDGVPEDSRVKLDNYRWLEARVAGDEARADKVRRLTALADEIGTTLAPMAIAWCLKNPNVGSVILGASRVEQLTENLTAVDAQARLTPEIMAKIEGILENAP